MSKRIAVLTLTTAATLGCDVNSALERVSEARHVSADLHVQFTKAADASNRAVMADTDEASVAFAREAEQARRAVQKDAAALTPVLQGLGYSEETGLLADFGKRFAEYEALDRTILQLAVENTNLKAQRLSFGPGQESADAFRDSVEPLAALDQASKWQVKALAANAVASGARDPGAPGAPHRRPGRRGDDAPGEADADLRSGGAQGPGRPRPAGLARFQASGSPPPRPPSTGS